MSAAAPSKAVMPDTYPETMGRHIIDEKIEELEKMAARSRGQLSEFNQNNLAWFRFWRDLFGCSVMLEISPRGVLDPRNPNPSRFVETDDKTAAELLAWAESRKMTVKIASDEDAARERARWLIEAQTQLARAAKQQAELNKATITALFGTEIPAGMAHVVPVTAGASTSTPVATGPTVTDIGPLAEMVNVKVYVGLARAGFGSIEKIAAASVEQVAAVDGMTKAHAARLIADCGKLVNDKRALEAQ